MHSCDNSCQLRKKIKTGRLKRTGGKERCGWREWVKKMGELKGRLKGQGTEQSGLCLLPLSLSQVQSLWRSGPRVSRSADYGAASINSPNTPALSSSQLLYPCPRRLQTHCHPGERKKPYRK